MSFDPNDRCAEPPHDRGTTSAIEVNFGIPVHITSDQERRLHALLDEIAGAPWNQPQDGVHWVSGCGGKVMWREPDEPDYDMNVLSIETTSREFVSERERERTLKRRGQ